MTLVTSRGQNNPRTSGVLTIASMPLSRDYVSPLHRPNKLQTVILLTIVSTYIPAPKTPISDLL